MKRRLLLFGCLFALYAHADVTPPCSPIGAGHVHAVGGIVPGSINTYCVSDWGSSDAWYPAFTPPAYQVIWDAFSGDDAANLRYSIGGNLLSGTGWLPPLLDAGYLQPTYDTHSAWLVTTALHATGSGTQTSSLTNPNGSIDITITTGAIGLSTIYQDYTIFNGGISLLSGMRFADYFNFHPNASSVAFTDGVVTYGGLAGIVVNGNPGDVNYLGPGQMCFARVGDIACSILSNAHDIGNVQPTLPVNGVRPGSPIKDVENNAYNNVFGPSGPGDYAGSLAYDLPDLQPGASVSIRVLKGNVLPVQAGAPEPASFVLIGSALAAIGVRRRRRKNRSA